MISSLHRGGAERQLVELATRIDTGRYEPFVALCDPTDEFGLALGEASRFSLRSPDGATVLTLARLARVVEKLKPDVVHGFGGMMNLFTRFAARIHRPTRAISSVRAGQPSLRDLTWDRLTYRLSSAIIANSVGIRDVLVARAKIPAGRIDVVENGVDTERFYVGSAEPREGLTLTLPARRTREKNHLGVLDALGLLAAKKALPAGLRVRFVGREADAGYEREMRTQIARLQLAEAVSFEPVTEAMTALYHASDGVLLPSHFEGMPNVVLEALASGVPALVSDAANRDGIVREGVHGIEFGGTTAEQIAAGIVRFAAQTRDDRRAMGARGRAMIEAKFTLGRMVDRTCEIYDRVLREAR